MTDQAFEHPLPWTEREYWALGETMSRVELIDGCLVVSPNDCFAHHRMRGRVYFALYDSVEAAGLLITQRITLRLGQARIATPDFIVHAHSRNDLYAQAAEVTLVGEVVSEHTAPADCVLKRQLYAEAGIPWYLLVEPALPDYPSVTLRLLRLASGHYVRHAVAEPGQTLKPADPFPFELRTTDLIDLEELTNDN